MFMLGIIVFFVIIFLVFFISDTLHTMAERKFSRGLHKPGMAAQLRETVSQVVRESAVLVSGYLTLIFIWLLLFFFLFLFASL